MIILLLEDRGSRLYELKEFLKYNGHEVFDCEDVYCAIDMWQKKSAIINCVIVDLAMSPNGLNDQEASQSGYYTGWVFLWEYVLQTKPGIASRCIIFSAWSDSFKLFLPTPEQRGGIEDECIISKNDSDAKNKLLKTIKRISDLAGGH